VSPIKENIEYGCIKCWNPIAGGGSINAWRKKGIIPNLKILHAFSRHTILKCKQCENYFWYNGKVFNDCQPHYIPALLNWEESYKFFQNNIEQFRYIIENASYPNLYTGLFKVVHQQYEEEAIIVLSYHPLKPDLYEPLKLMDTKSEIEFIRKIEHNEISNKSINKYFVWNLEFK